MYIYIYIYIYIYSPWSMLRARRRGRADGYSPPDEYYDIQPVVYISNMLGIHSMLVIV